MTVAVEAREFVDQFNADYETRHRAFEEQFWGTKMNLQDARYSAEELTRTKTEMESLLQDKAVLEKAQQLRSQCTDDDRLIKTLDIIIRTCQCYQMNDEAAAIRRETSQLESSLEMARNAMKLGYSLDDETFVEASSVKLRNLLRTADEESVRRAAYEGLRSIGPYVLSHGFVEIIKLRNRLAKSLGFVDCYDYKVTNAEGFGKDRLFEILDTLEQGTRSILEKARKYLVEKYGPDAAEPWNMSYKMAGSVVAKMDPYFPFAASVERYVKSYAALGISYKGATINLDLLDRPQKYSNGFCHWPQPAWEKSDGTWQPSVANFTSLADPTAVGSGHTALKTLLHEAGHAAHFANVVQPSPLFSQERAPTSVAYAETQSMFLDSLLEDAAWNAKYAKHSKTSEVIPFDILKENIEATHPFAVFPLRAMLAVSYFEKALYELPEEAITVEKIEKLADQIETTIQGGLSPRPLLSVPHLVSDEASCYYHGYTMAEMAVYQTRDYFLGKYGYIVDNPEVGPTLTTAYWSAGNSKPFLDLVLELTGKPLTGDAWIKKLNEPLEDKIVKEKANYNRAIEEGSRRHEQPLESLLDMTVRFVHGDELIADSSKSGIIGACEEFESYIYARVAEATS
ncbi:hypothetical protein FisN_2Lh103 [Fistulifera solaris]|uniref:Peptidase M3A/M3B catalytic domain-containing protein n=1 Tax=Fistulifera solaris TaxID=1519565 RepID=A0A1Z5JX25_FISSO|nr:hypothetical protein FisN_2Lh103 [Fistulifera solaris]|eukprot:GAX18449.1 hypothetical protein FisN_2Lh103 [Fistulifera solaris]